MATVPFRKDDLPARARFAVPAAGAEGRGQPGRNATGDPAGTAYRNSIPEQYKGKAGHGARDRRRDPGAIVPDANRP